ncbi:DUF6797 domain-containing protein [Planctomycetaceae bacterium SH139]
MNFHAQTTLSNQQSAPLANRLRYARRFGLPCWYWLACLFVLLVSYPAVANGQQLEQTLLATPTTALAQQAVTQGDAQRGAILFYQPYMACAKCHVSAGEQNLLAPSLTNMEPRPTDVELVEAILLPAKVIKKGYETQLISTVDGRIFQGRLVERFATSLVLLDAAKDFQPVTIPLAEVESESTSATSTMPAGQVNALASKQQFLDLIRYLIEIRDGGEARAKQLQPPPAAYAAAPLAEYEADIDHAGMITGLDEASLERGAAIYGRVCANCHGTLEQPGSLPTSLRFGTGKFKNGSDPFTMYQTLTRGFGMMVPQSWMVPSQKYDVIHYIREVYLKPHNPSQYFLTNPEYLATLPVGSSKGPAPSESQPWEEMDYGPNLIATYEIGNDGDNFAYKGNAVRLDPGPGGVSRGNAWSIFDFDTLRVAATWTGEQFIDYRGINFNGQHNIHPRVVGEITTANPTGPGWARPGTDSFVDPRLVGRDGRRYGPLPRDWAQYRGMYYHGNQTIVDYTVGKTEVLEMAGQLSGPVSLPARHFEIGPRAQDMLLRVTRASHLADRPLKKLAADTEMSGYLTNVRLWHMAEQAARPVSAPQEFTFDGDTFLQINDAAALEMDTKDYTIHATIRTTKDGTIFCKTRDQAEWAKNGKSLFVRDGRLTFDIGWVGAVSSDRRIDNGLWHHVAVTYVAENHRLRFFVDGRPAGGGQLRPMSLRGDQVARIGFTAENFPETSVFKGSMKQLSFWQAALEPAEIRSLDNQLVNGKASADAPDSSQLVARWSLKGAAGEAVATDGGSAMPASVVRDLAGAIHKPTAERALLCGLASDRPADVAGIVWEPAANGDLLLRIPAGENRLRFTLWLAQLAPEHQAKGVLAEINVANPSLDLTALTAGGPPRWPGEVMTTVELGESDGPLAVDVLSYPIVNPWLCRMRLTGHDFYADGDRAAVCDWDGNVWLVSRLSQLDQQTSPQLKWRRIASGLFQPLGLKIIDDVIHVTCRDQLCRLHDLNGDDAIDWYACVNNDHQVTDHFHEFAMGLQTDEAGNFYYAKSARHALKAVVPHHGTLLKITPDGLKTEIVASGFRAANGVCLNPDGTFIVTDQEGHWNPKNRINWVEPGGFYGNMYGYHDVVDESDEAMEKPLCWITNAFDRSPAELLWVDSERWGPLDGRLLNLSYGYGKVFLVPHETVNGQIQGGMIELPIPQFPTGTIRGRFHPADGQLYLSGMYSWAGSQQEPGGFFRVRATGNEFHLPLEIRAIEGGVELEFSQPLARDVAEQAGNFQVTVWDLKRTKQYGSAHYNEKTLPLTQAVLHDDHRLRLAIPDLKPTRGMEIRYQLKSADGRDFSGTIHNTVHQLGKVPAIDD